ncbi:MAG: sensor histidine kinase [Chitinophagaceae bacterium]|nr:sensor histidine kinase [Chitinophagaceae bacterium]
MKRFATLLFFYFCVFFCSAQSPTDQKTVTFNGITEDSSLAAKTFIYIDSNSSLSVPEVLHKPFIPFDNFKNRRKIPANMVTGTLYLKIHYHNNTEKEITGFLFPGNHYTLIEIYKPGTQPYPVIENGGHPGYRKLSFTAGETGDMLIKLKPLKNDFNYINPFFIPENRFIYYEIHKTGLKSDIQLYGLVLSGVLLMMILFMVTNYIINHKQEFLYNALYSLCMFLLIFLNSTLSRTNSPFSKLYFSYFDFFLLVTGTIFYITFTRKFLNTKNDYELIDKIFKYGERFVLLLLGIYTYLHFFTSTFLPQYFLEIIMKILILVIGIVFISLAFKHKKRLFNYLAAGNAMLILFSVISLFLLLLKIRPVNIFYSSLFYYNTGIVFELAFFLMGLNYKNRSEIISGIKEQEALKLEAEKKEFETQLAIIKAQQEERNRISADMHDDLGAGMTTISLYSELAKTKLKDNPIPEIDKISSSANELLNKMNAIIWSMSSSNDSLNNMIGYIRSYAQEYFENTGVTCRISIPDNLPNIEVIGEIRRNVFLVVKEALNNILKHAKATEVSITLERVEGGLSLFIHDNGKGIDLSAIRQFGNGLKNMKKRMQDIDIDFRIENKNGTLITLHRKIATF